MRLRASQGRDGMAIERMTIPLGAKSRNPSRKGKGAAYRRLAFALGCAGIVFMFTIVALRQQGMGGDTTAVATIDRSALPTLSERLNTDAANLRERPDNSRDPNNRRSAQDIESESGVTVHRQQGGQAPGASIIMVPSESGENERLVPAPDTRIAERTTNGILPKTGEGGLLPRRVYARPAPKEAGPRIAVVLTGVGVNARGTTDAISRLSGEITLAFSPYGRDLESQVTRARRDGHEILLQIPMEPQDYPENDPGPHTLRTGAKPKENLDRLHWLMSRFSGYVGVMNFLGGKLMNSSAELDPLLQDVAKRGLLFVDDGSTVRSRISDGAAKTQLPLIRADRVVENVGAGLSAKAALADAEKLAQRGGRAIVILPALPANIEMLSQWQDDARRRGFVLAPISSMLTPRAP